MSQASDDPRPGERRSASAEAAALRREELEQGDADHDAPPSAPEAPGGVPNRHSASAEAADLRWRETHPDDAG